MPDDISITREYVVAEVCRIIYCVRFYIWYFIDAVTCNVYKTCVGVAEDDDQLLAWVDKMGWVNDLIDGHRIYLGAWA